MKKIAIVHDWFATPGGSEKVVEQFFRIFPDADIFSLFDFLAEKDRKILHGRVPHTSFLQKTPFINGKNYRAYLALMPMAIEQLDFSGYNMVISSSHAVAKGIITGPEQLHISYIHNPLRYAWDMQNAYLKNTGLKNLKGALARILLHYIRSWDVIASTRPDVLIANSGFIAKRIQKFYRRDASVIYPPVDTSYFTPSGNREDFYLTASRFVPYKRIDLIAQSFRNLPDKKLVIIGDGPELPHIKPFIGENVIWLGYQPIDVLREHLRHCRAFVFAAKEDFGIMPLEAQACGAPVIAFGEGGATETVRGQGDANPTGLFFASQTTQSLESAVIEFETLNQPIRKEDCRANAEHFSNERFQAEFRDFVIDAWKCFQHENGMVNL